MTAAMRGTHWPVPHPPRRTAPMPTSRRRYIAGTRTSGRLARGRAPRPGARALERLAAVVAAQAEGGEMRGAGFSAIEPGPLHIALLKGLCYGQASSRSQPIPSPSTAAARCHHQAEQGQGHRLVHDSWWRPAVQHRACGRAPGRHLDPHLPNREEAAADTGDATVHEGRSARSRQVVRQGPMTRRSPSVTGPEGLLRSAVNPL